MVDLKALFEQRKLNNAATAIELPVAFTNKFPDMKREKAEKLFARYLEAVADEVLTRLPFLTDGETYVSTKGLLNSCGDFKYQKNRYWVWNEFKDIYPFFIVQEKGSNIKATSNLFEKNSRVKIMNARFLNMLLHERNPKTVFEHYYTDQDIEREDIEIVPIAMENLANYIGNTEYALEQDLTNKRGLREKLQKNLWQATIVYKIGQHVEQEFGGAALPMVPSPSPFGRLYYKGINIQNVTKEVRSAILGHHFQYDMNAASFAIKLFLYGQLNGGDNELINTAKGTYTREYLANKDRIRERLAAECWQGVNLSHEMAVRNVKNALTAIGFGAKTSGKTWMTDEGLKGTALSEIIVSADARERFLNDKWVKAFLAEQTVIEDAILADLKTRDDYEAIAQVVREANGVNGRVTRAGLLAWVYQQWEKHIMDIAVGVLVTHGIKVLARVHDAFLVSEKVPSKVMDEIAVAWGLRPYLKFDCDEVRGWIDPDFKRDLDTAKREEEAHRARIRDEEYKAVVHALRQYD